MAFEAAPGNLNFAKRYGQMGVWVRDTVTGRTVAASKGASRAPFSAYNPSISGNGRRVAFETSDSATGALAVWVADLRTGRSEAIARPIGVTSDLYEPSLSADGRFLAFTAVSRASSCATWTRARRSSSPTATRGTRWSARTASGLRSRAGRGWSSRTSRPAPSTWSPRWRPR